MYVMDKYKETIYMYNIDNIYKIIILKITVLFSLVIVLVLGFIPDWYCA